MAGEFQKLKEASCQASKVRELKTITLRKVDIRDDSAFKASWSFVILNKGVILKRAIGILKSDPGERG